MPHGTPLFLNVSEIFEPDYEGLRVDTVFSGELLEELIVKDVYGFLVRQISFEKVMVCWHQLRSGWL